MQQKQQQSLLYDNVVQSPFIRQFKSILYNNIILNHRKRLFIKEMMLIFLIFFMCILSCIVLTKINSGNGILGSIKSAITAYNILVMLFISWSQVILYADSRQKYSDFFKAYGMSTAVYIFSWLLYNLIIGILKYLIYILLIYAYLKVEVSRYSKDFEPQQPSNDYPFNVTMELYCIFCFVAYLGTYSYSLLAATVISHNQIGFKLIVPVLLLGIYSLYDMQLIINQPQIFSFISPTGWLTRLSYIGFSNTITYRSKESYIITIIIQILVPICLSIIIQFIKVNRFSIIKKLTRIIFKTQQQIEQIQMTQIKSKNNKEPLIIVKKLSKSYCSRKVLQNIDLQIYKGQIIILFGKNGSGKTTLINILSNIQYFTQGKIMSQKNLKIGISLEGNYFQNDLTIRENLLFYANLKGIVLKNQNYIMEEFQLSDFCDKQYYKISGGNRKRLSIACAFLGKNDLIILDEPTLGLDIVAKRQIQNLIIHYKQKSKNKDLTILISTCQSELVFINIADRLLVINNRKLIFNKTINYMEGQNIFMIAIVTQLQETLRQKVLSQISLINNIKISQQNNKIYCEFAEYQLQYFMRIIKKYQLFKKLTISTSKVSDKIKQIIDLQLDDFNQKLTLFEQYKSNYEINKNNKQSFFNLLFAAFLIAYYQIIPTLLDALYFLTIIIIYSRIIALVSFNLQQDLYLYQFYSSLIDIYAFIYSHVYISYLQNRQSHYQATILQMGMKKISYWIAYYLINYIIIVIPFVIVEIFTSKLIIPTQIASASIIFLYFISTSYFFTLFVQINHIYKTFLPTIFFLFYLVNDLMALGISLSKFNQKINLLLFTSMIQITISCIFILLFFVIRSIIYKSKNIKKYIQAQSKNVQRLIEEGIDEKLNVANALYEKSHLYHHSILVQNIYLKYKAKRYGIKGLNLIIPEGSIFGILGMNGSGKSTTIKLILNDLFKTYGRVYFKGQQINSQTSEIYENISVSPQSNYFNEFMTVKNHLRIFCSIKGIPFRKQIEQIQLLLKLFDMDSEINQRINQLSGGSKRKLKFMTALLGTSKYLFLDQPTIGVDDFSQKKLEQILHYLRDNHQVTTVLVSHKLQEVQRLCSNLAIIKRGALLYTDLKNSLINQYSRGYKIIMYSQKLQELKAIVTRILDKMFKVYELILVKQHRMIKVVIPWQRLKFETQILTFVHELFEENVIYGYELKQQDLQDVYKYIVFRTQQNYALRLAERNKVKQS